MAVIAVRAAACSQVGAEALAVAGATRTTRPSSSARAPLGPGAGGKQAVFLYDATTGHNADLFPSNTASGDQFSDPLISSDGTHVDAVYDSASNSADQGIVVKAISSDTSTTITASDILVKHPFPELELMSVSSDGSDFAYWENDSVQEDGWFAVYSGGSVLTAPQLEDTFPETADITGDGTSILYTASLVGLAPTDYPGVYEWQLPRIGEKERTEPELTTLPSWRAASAIVSVAACAALAGCGPAASGASPTRPRHLTLRQHPARPLRLPLSQEQAAGCSPAMRSAQCSASRLVPPRPPGTAAACSPSQGEQGE
jgi:hypothetical protein